MFFKDTEPGKNAGDRLMVVDGSEYTITTGEQQVYDVNTRDSPDNVVKVTLVWTDPPGEPIANVPLVNNLDLTVEYNGQTYQGNNQLDTTNTAEQARAQPRAPRAPRARFDLLRSAPARTSSDLAAAAAAEQVIVPGTTAGIVKITVKGTAVTEGPQKYALVVTGPLDNISPPPALNAPSPPLPPRPPPTPLADQIALGVSVPLLVLAGLAGGRHPALRPAPRAPRPPRPAPSAPRALRAPYPAPHSSRPTSRAPRCASSAA